MYVYSLLGVGKIVRNYCYFEGQMVFFAHFHRNSDGLAYMGFPAFWANQFMHTTSNMDFVHRLVLKLVQ